MKRSLKLDVDPSDLIGKKVKFGQQGRDWRINYIFKTMNGHERVHLVFLASSSSNVPLLQIVAHSTGEVSPNVRPIGKRRMMFELKDGRRIILQIPRAQHQLTFKF